MPDLVLQDELFALKGFFGLLVQSFSLICFYSSLLEWECLFGVIIYWKYVICLGM